MNRFVWPLVGFVLLVVLLAVGLNLNPREVPSPLVGKPAPAFTLARLDAPEKTFSPQDMRGQVWLLNVWASWCVSCRVEHPVLVEMMRQQNAPAIQLVGLNYKEVRGDGALDASKLSAEEERRLAIERARGWLGKHGDPYSLSVLDIDGRVGIDFGVYGVPETFLIDAEGRIRYKHIGPITPDSLQQVIMPKVEELRRAG